jgi:hypothetical protein
MTKMVRAATHALQTASQTTQTGAESPAREWRTASGGPYAARMARPFSYQRLLLFTFLFAIATCGAIGLWAVVFAGFNDTVAQILATSASVAGASVLGMAAAVPWSQRRWHPIGPVGVVLTAAGLGMMLFIIWSNTRW